MDGGYPAVRQVAAIGGVPSARRDVRVSGARSVVPAGLGLAGRPVGVSLTVPRRLGGVASPFTWSEVRRGSRRSNRRGRGPRLTSDPPGLNLSQTAGETRRAKEGLSPRELG